jgi:hypothetical protein
MALRLPRAGCTGAHVPRQKELYITKRIWIGALLMAFVALTMTAHARWATRAGAGDAPGEMAPNEFGVAESVHRSGLIDRSNPFFSATRARQPSNGCPECPRCQRS